MTMRAERKRRLWAIGCILVVALVATLLNSNTSPNEPAQPVNSKPITEVAGVRTELASTALDRLPVKGRAPKTNYAREQFSDGWAEVDGCDMRNYILQRDLTAVALDTDNCKVLSGTLADPYTSTIIAFQRGSGSSSKVQIDHVVALSDAWQKGAQNIDVGLRAEFANDPLNLLAVDGTANQKKSDSDAASWLPPNKGYRCMYVARQIAVKSKYSLWVTSAERDAMHDVLHTCPEQMLPLVEM